MARLTAGLDGARELAQLGAPANEGDALRAFDCALQRPYAPDAHRGVEPLDFDLAERGAINVGGDRPLDRVRDQRLTRPGHLVEA